FLFTFALCRLAVAPCRHQGWNVFKFFTRDASRTSASFFIRSASLCGAPCCSSRKAACVAASASAFTCLENRTSPKLLEKEDRKRLTEYRESSQRSMTCSVVG